MAQLKLFAGFTSRLFTAATTANFNTDAHKVALLKNTYNPSDASIGIYTANDVLFTSIQSAGQECTGTNYTVKNIPMITVYDSVTKKLTIKYDETDNSNADYTQSLRKTIWANSTIANVRYAVIYRSSDNKCIALLDLQTNYSSVSGNFEITWNANGFMDIVIP